MHWNQPLTHYNSSAGTDEYLSDLSNYSDNESDLGSNDYNNYKSNYKSNNEEASCASTSIAKISLARLPNVKNKRLI